MLPDLSTVRPRDLTIEVAGGERRLRFTNETGNRGAGPLEIFPQAFSGADTNDCDGDGDATNDLLVHQRVYMDNDGDGLFDRETDTESEAPVAGCMVFHLEHDHWHFDAFARYALVDLNGAEVVVGTKRSWCITDSGEAPRFTLPGSPPEPVYPECKNNPNATEMTQGISPGWGDVYKYDLPMQYMVITGLPDGEYCLISTADPDNRLLETDDSNNSASVRIWLNGSSALKRCVRKMKRVLTRWAFVNVFWHGLLRKNEQREIAA